ncbi:hypothetical protein [Sulfurospirillum halorespirans]|uniref:Uncharacterized protein n=1 Tax=Sulfurospirillum halorespirans DSM 13726 TaxID=1193502 RepID=A0A1D7TN17_9BACT|nr:hypothetical protein [Sulfurospirillum halorespirans]AOO66370.1 hypothetical protein SHALO_2612 [Sulfurospirillum halorespirans DSM 13726]
MSKIRELINIIGGISFQIIFACFLYISTGLFIMSMYEWYQKGMDFSLFNPYYAVLLASLIAGYAVLVNIIEKESDKRANDKKELERLKKFFNAHVRHLLSIVINTKQSLENKLEAISSQDFPSYNANDMNKFFFPNQTQSILLEVIEHLLSTEYGKLLIEEELILLLKMKHLLVEAIHGSSSLITNSILTPDDFISYKMLVNKSILMLKNLEDTIPMLIRN